MGNKLLLLCIILIITESNVWAQNREAANIRGQVFVDGLGTPISEAEVEIKSNGKVLCSAITDSNGKYRIHNISPGHYTVIASLRGFLQTKKSVDLKGNEKALLNLGLQVGQLTDPPIPLLLDGIVRQRSGSPLPDTMIAVISAFDQQILAKAITDESGHFELSLNYGVQLILVITKPGFISVAQSILFDGRVLKQMHKAEFTLEQLNNE